MLWVFIEEKVTTILAFDTIYIKINGIR